MIGDQINSSTMSNYFNKRLICLAILVFRTVVFVTSSSVSNEGYVQMNQTGLTTEALTFIVYVCSSLNNCEPLATGLVVDNNWRGVFYNLCYDPKRCDKVLYHDFVFLSSKNDFRSLINLHQILFRFLQPLSMIPYSVRLFLVHALI
jgi:hypothetical protein